MRYPLTMKIQTRIFRHHQAVETKSPRTTWYSQAPTSRALQMMDSRHWQRSCLLALFPSSICSMLCLASSRGMILLGSTYSTTWPCIITTRRKFPRSERCLTIPICTLSRRGLTDRVMANRYQGVSSGPTITMGRVSESPQAAVGSHFKARVWQLVCRAACKWLAAVRTSQVAIIRRLTTKEAWETNLWLDRSPTTRSSCKVSQTMKTRTLMRVFSSWTRGSSSRAKCWFTRCYPYHRTITKAIKDSRQETCILRNHKVKIYSNILNRALHDSDGISGCDSTADWRHWGPFPPAGCGDLGILREEQEARKPNRNSNHTA